jgi:transposase-like protein
MDSERNPSVLCILFSEIQRDNFGTKTGFMKKQERINRQEEMISLIEQWQESGKTQQAFCREHELTFSTFYYWLKRYRQQIDESSFLPVEISSGSYIEIRYPGGVILQLPVAARLPTLKQLLSL